MNNMDNMDNMANMDSMDNMDNMDIIAQQQVQHQMTEVVVTIFVVAILAAPSLFLFWKIFTNKSLHTWFNISLGLAYLVSGTYGLFFTVIALLSDVTAYILV